MLADAPPNHVRDMSPAEYATAKAGVIRESAAIQQATDDARDLARLATSRPAIDAWLKHKEADA